MLTIRPVTDLKMTKTNVGNSIVDASGDNGITLDKFLVADSNITSILFSLSGTNFIATEITVKDSIFRSAFNFRRVHATITSLNIFGNTVTGFDRLLKAEGSSVVTLTNSSCTFNKDKHLKKILLISSII